MEEELKEVMYTKAIANLKAVLKLIDRRAFKIQRTKSYKANDNICHK